MRPIRVFLTTSDQETIKLAQGLGSLLTGGDVIALVGDLGSGKTWFTKGLALGLGISSDTVITSPSFALVNEYEGNYSFYHMDLFRLENLSELISAGLEEYLYSGGIAAIEWANRWPEILPDQRIEVEFVIIDDCRREITLSGHHPRAIEIIERLIVSTCY